MPRFCAIPGCKRRAYQETMDAKCKVHVIKYALDQGLAQVVQVSHRTINGERVKTATPVAVDTSALTAETLHSNNTSVQIIQVRSNADCEWRVVPVSEHLADLTSGNVRTVIISPKSNQCLPSELVAAASGISIESAAAGIVSNQTKASSRQASLKKRKERGENTKRRVWTQENSSHGNPLCTIPGCKSEACARVAGLKCMPHILAAAVEVEVEAGCIEVMILVEKDFLFEDKDIKEGMLHTLVFKELPGNIGGFPYDGKRYEYSEDVFFLAAYACSPEEVERDGVMI